MVGMNVQRDQYYRKELDLKLSMSYGPGRYDPAYEEGGQDYPFAYVRWTERRNMQAFLELVADGHVTPKALVTHRFDINNAEHAYALMSSEESYLGILITYAAEATAARTRRIMIGSGQSAAKNSSLGTGFIGAGNFAKSVLLPNLKKTALGHFTGVATATGLSCNHVAEKFGFDYATTDYREILNDPATGTVFIATRHDMHAPIVCEALQAGKNVFVEKPLAIDREQLDAVVAVAQSHDGHLTVGFNRRFSPMVRQAKAALASRSAPLVMIYRVNAGAVPADSWLHGNEGGGRIVGEVCHFIDTLQFLADAHPTAVQAVAAEDHPDAISIQLTFSDGSIGTIVYTSLGDRAFPKEYIEIFGSGRVITIEDFRRATFVCDGKRKTVRSIKQDKGFKEELEQFINAISHRTAAPIDLSSLVATTQTTFAIHDSLREKALVPVEGVAPREAPVEEKAPMMRAG
jgi:polar amino acid transport system substrate-binding protein